MSTTVHEFLLNRFLKSCIKWCTLVTSWYKVWQVAAEIPIPNAIINCVSKAIKKKKTPQRKYLPSVKIIPKLQILLGSNRRICCIVFRKSSHRFLRYEEFVNSSEVANDFIHFLDLWYHTQFVKTGSTQSLGQKLKRNQGIQWKAIYLRSNRMVKSNVTVDRSRRQLLKCWRAKPNNTKNRQNPLIQELSVLHLS